MFQIAWAATEKAATEEPGFFELALHYLLLCVETLALLFVSYIIARIVKAIVMNRVRKSATPQTHEEFFLLIERLVYYGTMLIMIVISFQIVGIDLTMVLGAISLGLGFAFKDILSNFVGGMVILSQHKLKIGDLIKVGDKIGKITMIDSRTTQMKSLDGTELIIPNSDMMTDVVQNFSANSFRRISLEVGVHYATPLDQAVGITLGSVKKNASVEVEPKPEVLCTEFADSAIILNVRFWVDSSENWWLIRSHIIQQIKLDFDAAGINIPFPIRTLSLDPYDDVLKSALHLPQQNVKSS